MNELLIKKSHPVIDAHTHIGDILIKGGGELIWEKGVSKPMIFDPPLGSSNF